MDRNIEELRIARLKSKFEIAKSYGSDQLTVPMPDLDALIAQLEAVQKELIDWRAIGEAAAQDDADWHKLADRDTDLICEMVNVLIATGERAKKAEAELSAANEKLSEPVVLPRMHVGFDGASTNAGDSVRNKAINDCAEAIRTAGFTVEGNADAE